MFDEFRPTLCAQALLRDKLTEAEQRAESAALSVPEATRPLLRQMDAQQTAARAREAQWEAAERALTDQLAGARATAERHSAAERAAVRRADECAAETKTAVRAAASERAAAAAAQREARQAQARAEELERQLHEAAARAALYERHGLLAASASASASASVGGGSSGGARAGGSGASGGESEHAELRESLDTLKAEQHQLLLLLTAERASVAALTAEINTLTQQHATTAVSPADSSSGAMLALTSSTLSLPDAPADASAAQTDARHGASFRAGPSAQARESSSALLQASVDATAAMAAAASGASGAGGAGQRGVAGSSSGVALAQADILAQHLDTASRSASPSVGEHYYSTTEAGAVDAGGAGAGAAMDPQHPQAAVVARLAASLKQREGEVASLRRLIGDLEATRDSLSDRLVALTAKHFQLYVLRFTAVLRAWRWLC